MRDIAHLLRPGHLAQLRDDPRRPRGVAERPLRRARAAQEREHRGGRRPADVPGHRHRDRDGQEGPARAAPAAATRRRSRAASSTPTPTTNLRYSQIAPLDMYEEKNTGNNLPAQIELYATDGDEYNFLFMAKGGGSANKSYLFQETKALLNPKSLARVPRRRSCARSAPRRARRTTSRSSSAARQRRAHAQDREARVARATSTTCRRRGNELGRAFRDLELGAEGRSSSRSATGIGAQFGGKYFCHDVRVIRLPRHGATCPVGDRRLVLGRSPGARQDHARRRVPRAARDAIRRSTCPTPTARRARRRGREDRSRRSR